MNSDILKVKTISPLICQNINLRAGKLKNRTLILPFCMNCISN